SLPFGCLTPNLHRYFKIVHLSNMQNEYLHGLNGKWKISVGQREFVRKTPLLPTVLLWLYFSFS
ncbi:MAG: hypothetical protein IIZ07_08185, partial [Ruminococcus sp.]|nr:hypothetical protein [Ruminococcus sp.]